MEKTISLVNWFPRKTETMRMRYRINLSVKTIKAKENPRMYEDLVIYLISNLKKRNIKLMLL